LVASSTRCTLTVNLWYRLIGWAVKIYVQSLVNSSHFTFIFLQDFPVLCQTCLGDNPYIRMVSIPSFQMYQIYMNTLMFCKFVISIVMIWLQMAKFWVYNEVNLHAGQSIQVMLVFQAKFILLGIVHFIFSGLIQLCTQTS